MFCYCSEKLQNNQIVFVKDFDDTNILKAFVRFSNLLWLYLSNEYSHILKKDVLIQ